MKKKALLMIVCLSASLTMFGCGKTQEQPQVPEVLEVPEETPTVEPSEEEVQEKEAPQEEEAQVDQADENMIENGDFSQGVGTWMTYLNGGEGTIRVNEDGQFVIDVTDSGNLDYSVQAYYDGFGLDQGVKYHLSFDMSVSKPRTVVWRVQLNGGDYHAYFDDEIKATEEMQHYEYEVTMEEASDPAPRLCFNVGVYDGDGDLGQHEIRIDNLNLHVLDASGKVAGGGSDTEKSINVNQVGYQTKDAKIASFRGDAITDSFQVIDVASGKDVFTGTMSDSVEADVVGEKTATGDFTAVIEPGTYKLVSGTEESAEFVIADDVYDQLLKDTVHMFYLQRCGEQLGAEFAGDFIHPACHDTEAVIYGSSQKKNVSGGWHDAGDYGRYVVAGAKAVADLLMAYEENPSVFTDDTDIPESGNGQADILDEVRYELDWMLKMQDEATGGVYHKVTCANFPGTVLPQDETEQLILSPISNTATGDFAAVMAMASRIYADSDKGFAENCLAAAQKALAYLEAHQSEAGFTNPSDIVTGEYGDGQCMDELFWALAELYRATGDSAYENKIKELGAENMNVAFGWADVAGYGMQTYLACEKKDSDLAAKVSGAFFHAAEQVKETSDADMYGSSIASEYPWGSNMTIANNGMLLVLAQKKDSTKTGYLTDAQRQLSYLLGTNATSYCFVTGYGSVTPEHPHHRPSQALGKAMKGMLVGGPNSNLEDPYAKAALADKPNAKRYADNDQSYSCNEITIYWNSPLVNLLAGLMK